MREDSHDCLLRDFSSQKLVEEDKIAKEPGKGKAVAGVAVFRWPVSWKSGQNPLKLPFCSSVPRHLLG